MGVNSYMKEGKTSGGENIEPISLEGPENLVLNEDLSCHACIVAVINDASNEWILLYGCSLIACYFCYCYA